ncbi:MAG: sigma-54 dependent transcriptional regulator [Kiritimatiellae bacterium]|nr:sigma-54 dependent transcriptional regulator [Kiritimatiellia bacterium]
MSDISVLIVEDDPDGGLSVKEAIEESGCRVTLTNCANDGLIAFRREPYDVVLTDLALPDMDGVEVLRRIRKLSPETPVIIMTAYGSIDSSVQALKAGAYDYITKPLELDDLQAKVARAAETSGLRRKVDTLKKTIQTRYGIETIIAHSPGMKELISQIQTVADTQATVLITGESGTGKELVARALHAESRRADQPFVAVNCAAFPENLLESELFGHEKGAFTGAAAQHKGAFERAGDGTLFLDEIGDAPLSVQVKLLRVLEERELTRVGGSATVAIKARLLSATNRDLNDLVADGAFRQDLLYRLMVVNLHLPPLRERREEIRPMTDAFIARACADHGRAIHSVAPSFYERLEQEDWPGNVRQLRNVVEAAVVMATRPELDALSLDALPGADRSITSPKNFVIPEGLDMEALEKEIFIQTLRRYDGNRSLSAEKLGISRRTIQRKIQDYDLPF